MNSVLPAHPSGPMTGNLIDEPGCYQCAWFVEDEGDDGSEERSGELSAPLFISEAKKIDCFESSPDTHANMTDHVMQMWSS